MPPSQADLHLHPTSRGLNAGELEAGRHAVLDIPVSHGLSVPHGVLIDDHLDRPDREQIDASATQAIEAWHERCDSVVTCGSLSIADIWHSELFAEVFLPAARVLQGVRRTIEATGATRLVMHGLDPELADALLVALPSVAGELRQPGPIERYPGEDAAPQGVGSTSPRWRRLAQTLLNTVGAPSAVRGTVIVVPYYSTLKMLEHLALAGGPAPVVYTAFPPPPALAARAALRGGWIGLPGRWAQRRAGRLLAEGLARAGAIEPSGLLDPAFDALLHRRALRCLADRALPSVGLAPLLDRELSRGKVRLVLVPFDHEPVAKVLVRAAQAHAIPVLAVQHGYEVDKCDFVPGELSDAIGQWSRWDLEALPSERRRRARILGNPGCGEPVPGAPRSDVPPHAVVLLEHKLRSTTQASRRITAQHLDVAFAGLGGSRHPWRITVRPHPADPVSEFRELVTELTRGHQELATKVAVDARTPILELFRSAHLCVGARSTASLETALTGTRLVMLRPEPLAALPPLDGSGGVPHATNAPELSRAIDSAMDEAEPPGRAELLEALGCNANDATAELLNWMEELAQRGEAP